MAIESVEDLRKDEFLGNVPMKIVTATAYAAIPQREKLTATLQFLNAIFTELKKHIKPKIGSDFVAGSFAKFFGEAKIKTIEANNLDDTIAKTNEWYILDGFVGTSEEKALIQFVKDSLKDLKNQYQEIYLVEK